MRAASARPSGFAEAPRPTASAAQALAATIKSFRVWFMLRQIGF